MSSIANRLGPQGPKGPKGDKGDARLSPQVSRALVVLFLLPSLIAVAAVIGVIVDSVSYQAAQRRQQQVQEQQGRIVERKLCQTLDGLVQLRPPPGNPATNPSRAFEQRLHEKLSQLAPDVGCPVAKGNGRKRLRVNGSR